MGSDNHTNLSVLVAAIVLMLATLLPARVIYVAPAGGQGDGSQAAPLATPADAVGAAQPGDTIVLRAGSYRLSSPLYIDRSSITLTTIDGEKATLVGVSQKADDLAATVIVAADGVTLSSLRIQGGFYGVKIEPASGESVRRVTLRDLHVGGTGADCIKATGADRLLIESCNIGPSGAVQLDNAEGIDIIGSLGVTIRNCTIRDVATNGIYLKGGTRNGLVEYCTVIDAGHGGILLGQDTDLEYMRGRVRHEAIQCAARNNLIVNTTVAGLAAYSAQDVVFENNTLQNVATRGQAGFWVVTNSRSVPSERVTFKGNIVSMAGARPAVVLLDPGDQPTLAANIYFNRDREPTFRREFTRLGKSDQWTFAQWQAAMNGDHDSMVADPELDEKRDYRPRRSGIQAFGRQPVTRPAAVAPMSGATRLRSQIGGGRE
jgi:hypothetical protein